MLNRNGRILLSPSDLNDFVECGYRTTLARQVALGERAKPHVADEGAKLLADKGMVHELEFLARVRDDGRDVVEIPLGDIFDFDAANARVDQAGFVGSGCRKRGDHDHRVRVWRMDDEQHLGASGEGAGGYGGDHRAGAAVHRKVESRWRHRAEDGRAEGARVAL